MVDFPKLSPANQKLLTHAPLDEPSQAQLADALRLTQIQFLIEKGELSLAQQELAEMNEESDKTPSSRAGMVEACTTLMQKYHADKKDKKVLEVFQDFSHMLENDCSAHFLSGLASRRLNEEEKAIHFFEKSIDLDSGRHEPYLALGELLKSTNPLEAMRLYTNYHNRNYNPAGTKAFVKRAKSLLSDSKAFFNFKEIRLAILGNFTLQPLQPHLEAACFKIGVLPEMFFGGYDLYIQEIADPQSELYQFNPKLTFLFLDSHTLMPELFGHFFDLPPEQRLEVADQKIEQTLGLLDLFLEKSSSSLVVSNFIMPRRFHMGIYSSLEPAGEREILDRMNDRLRDHAKHKTSRLYVLDTDRVLSNAGKDGVADEKMRFLAKMIVSEKALPHLTGEIIRYIRPTLGMTKKCLVLDLDNTLWGGILGEDGMEGIQLGLEPPGNVFYEFQKAVKSLQRKGILLAINSKNDFDLVKETFEKHPYMQLKLDDFSCVRVNWQDKAQNMRDIAKELNIGLDSFVFMDDNPAERFLIQQEMPEVQTVDMPQDFSEYVHTLLDLDSFEVLQLTDEDRKRKFLYQAEAKRNVLKTQISDLKKYLESLNIVVEVFYADSFAIPRVAQLTQRTNQFNLTTRRYQETDIQNFTKSPNHRVYYVKSSDRFGEHGIVGAGIIAANGNVWEIDTFLLSCRVVGRGIEQAFLHHIYKEAQSQNVVKLIGRYLSTQKNRIAESFFERENFHPVCKSKTEAVYELDIAKKAVPLPGHLRLKVQKKT